MDKFEKVKVIANAHHAQGEDKRSLADIQDHMKMWAAKGFLSKGFIDDCYDAIMENRLVGIDYEPGQYYNGYWHPRKDNAGRDTTRGKDQ